MSMAFTLDHNNALLLQLKIHWQKRGYNHSISGSFTLASYMKIIVMVHPKSRVKTILYDFKSGKNA